MDTSLKQNAQNLNALREQLTLLQKKAAGVSLMQRFEDEKRFDEFHARLPGLMLDYSKNHLDAEVRAQLLALARAAGLKEAMRAMRTGQKINTSENRAVLHTALRAAPDAVIEVDGENVTPKIQRELHRALDFAERVRSGAHRGFDGQTITDVVNIGIGGSDLGPQMAVLALKAFQGDLNVHFVANIDPAALAQVVQKLNPARTLFIVASKSFGTIETLQNALAAREWFRRAKAGEDAIARHFVAVSSNVPAAMSFGMDADNVFGLFDWVGGRYSVWSTIGLPLMLSIGREGFLQFLAGGRAMDAHFFETPFEDNLPVLMAMLGIWYSDFFDASTQAILTYDHGLRRFAAHIQQVDMESNGKSATREGEPVAAHTGAVVWGEEGTNSQHAFFQLLHQGTRLIPADFILVLRSPYEDDLHRHQALVANAIAQTRALMVGKDAAAVEQELAHLDDNARQELVRQKVFSGNRPSTSIVLDEMTPYHLGLLLALYEHKVFVQGIVWNINSFDQWGVELGKKLAEEIFPNLADAASLSGYDASTAALIDAYRSRHESA